MRPFLVSIIAGVALLAGCAAPNAPAVSEPDAGKIARARADCQNKARLQVSTGEINAGGGLSYNPFISARAFDDCMRAHGFSADASGEFLSAPDSQRQMGE